jgi:class 3 adenylate cyclase
MEYRVLGPLEVRDGAESIPLAGAKQRALLALLLVNANHVLSRDRLIDELWGDQPPETAVQSVQVYVSRLRKLLPSDTLLTRRPGYLLKVEPDELDLQRFERLVSDGREALARDDPRRASDVLREALALWRGPALAEFDFEPFAQSEIGRLEDLRLAAVEERLDADLALGRHADLIGELEALVAENPYRERFRGELMLALYRSGRQAEALQAYQHVHSALSELGIEPNLELRELERSILNQEPALDRPPAPPSAAAPPLAPPTSRRETRKTVTILFADVTDSTELGERLDPEARRRVMTSYFACVRDVLERHGGTVENVAGDAVMAVFGVPVLHEDDALRALRAAAEMPEALAGLNEQLDSEWGVRLAVRVGVNTGEVIAGNGAQGASSVSGDAVSTAARLEQAAEPGEVLLGAETYRRVRDKVRVKPAQPSALEGKRARLAAWRLVELLPDVHAFERPIAGPFVGREEELAFLRHEFERAASDGCCRQVTLLGTAGIGKSRLARELLAVLDEQARVVIGRCLPYGEGITYWPLVEIVKELAGHEPHAALAAVLAGDEQAGLVADRIAAAVMPEAAVASSEETQWAVRRLFEALARTRPLIVVLDDIHWAEPTFLDLIEYLNAFARSAPIMLLCLARPDLLETRPSWAGPRVNTSLLCLEPLSPTEAETLIEGLSAARELVEEQRARIAVAAEGNPLFLEQMVALLDEEDVSAEQAPPTIQALLAARVDRLSAGERALVECAAVEGRRFHRGALATLLPPDMQADLGTTLIALLHKELIRSDRSAFATDDGFRFAHILIRDAAYAAIPKQERAALHERYGDWLEGRVGERASEYDAILGYHFEQACRYEAELGLVGERGIELAGRAARRLTSAGTRALHRGDLAAALKLLDRALAVLRDPAPERPAVQVQLAGALAEAGELGRAAELLDEAVEAARDAGDRALELRALIERALQQMRIDPEGTTEELREIAEEAIPVFEEFGDELGLATGWFALAVVNVRMLRMERTAEAYERALVHARRAGDPRLESLALLRLTNNLVSGPTPVEAAIDRCHSVLAECEPSTKLEAVARVTLGELEAMRCNFERARALIAQGRAIFEELGLVIGMLNATHVMGTVEMRAGRPDAAEDAWRDAYAMIERGIQPFHRAQCAGDLAQALYAQGRYEDAEPFAEICKDISGDSLAAQVQWRRVQAKLLAKGGEVEKAEHLAREAVRRSKTSDATELQADALLDLGEVLLVGDSRPDGVCAIEEAVRLYEQKGNVTSAANARALLERFEAHTA